MQDFNPNIRLERNRDKFEIPVNGVTRTFRSLTVTLSTGDTIRGLDLSHWNDDDDLDPVVLKANGIDFVILKVTEGTSYTDPTFETKYKKFLAAGIIVLPYHFFRGNLGGAPQATYCRDALISTGFLEAINYTPIVWGDVETEDGVSVTTRRNRLLAFLQTLVAFGFQAGVYSSPYYWNLLIGLVDWIKDYWQWDAHWTSAASPTLPQGWSKEKTIMWQNGIYPTHSWVEPVIGASGKVDHNYFFGSLDDLKALLNYQEVPPPTGECNCQEELNQLTSLVNQQAVKLNELTVSLSRVETEMNNNKLEIYNLQQSYYGIANEVEKLIVANQDLDKRLSALETFLSQLKNILCQ